MASPLTTTSARRHIAERASTDPVQEAPHLKRTSISARNLRRQDQEVLMKKQFLLSPPLFGFAVATRAALGMGIGLLLADKIPQDKRPALALTLVSVGAATTIPLARSIFASRTTTPAYS
jgi:hypothetical protein